MWAATVATRLTNAKVEAEVPTFLYIFPNTFPVAHHGASERIGYIVGLDFNMKYAF